MPSWSRCCAFQFGLGSDCEREVVEAGAVPVELVDCAGSRPTDGRRRRAPPNRNRAARAWSSASLASRVDRPAEDVLSGTRDVGDGEPEMNEVEGIEMRAAVGLIIAGYCEVFGTLGGP